MGCISYWTHTLAALRKSVLTGVACQRERRRMLGRRGPSFRGREGKEQAKGATRGERRLATKIGFAGSIRKEEDGKSRNRTDGEKKEKRPDHDRERGLFPGFPRGKKEGGEADVFFPTGRVAFPCEGRKKNGPRLEKGRTPIRGQGFVRRTLFGGQNPLKRKKKKRKGSRRAGFG